MHPLCYLCAKNVRSWLKFDKVLTKNNAAQFFGDTVTRETMDLGDGRLDDICRRTTSCVVV